MGRAKRVHSKKLTEILENLLNAPIAIKFGGDPTGVAQPPIDAAKAKKISITCSCSCSIFIWAVTAKTMGIRIAIAAVLESHIDKKAHIKSKPTKNENGDLLKK